MPETLDTVQDALMEDWRDQFSGVMESMADFRPDTEILAGAHDAPNTDLWWKQPLSAAPGAAMWVGAAPDTWMELGSALLAAAGIDEADPNDAKDSYLEVVRQAFGGFARLLTGRLGHEVTCVEGSEEVPPAGAAAASLGLTAKGKTLPRLAVRFSRELLDAMHPAPAAPAETSQEPADDIAELPARACRTLDLLLDVEMPVSVSFGRTRVRIQEVLKLITGSIIELDRAISEPVEVVVNNCVVARGMVVVVDGNYGVRIDEVMSRKERLEQSRKYLLPVHAQRH